MKDRAGNEQDNEICRMLLRKRGKLLVGRIDPFEDWATEFSCDGRLYYISSQFSPYGTMRRLFIKSGDERVHFHVAEHLFDTLWNVVQDRQAQQRSERKAHTLNAILSRTEEAVIKN